MKALRSILLVSLFLFLCVSTVYAQWTQSNQNTGSIMSFSVLTPPPPPGSLYSGRYNDGVYLSADNGATWTSTGGTTGMTCTNINAVAAISTSNLFVGTLYGGAGTGLYRSTDGTNWNADITGLTSTNVYTFALSSDHVTIYAGTGNGIFAQTNPYATWNAKGVAGHPVKALIFSAGNGFAGTSDNGVYLSTDNGATWTVAANTGLTNLNVNALAVNGANLFAGTEGGGVFLSTNNGTSWTAVNGTLSGADLTVRALLINGGNLAAGTYGGGVFLSTDNGTSWTADNTSLTDLNINALAVTPNGMNFVAGTNVGGAWYQTIGASSTTYYSKNGTDPTLNTSWNTKPNGSGSDAPASGTFSSGNTFSIQGGHSMTVTSAWMFSGGTFVQVNGTLIVGASGSIDFFGSSTNLGVTQSGNLMLTSGDITVGSSATLQVMGNLDCGNRQISGAGTTTINGIVNIDAVDGIYKSGGAGNIQTTTRNFNSSATYSYGGSSAQHTGYGLPTNALIVLGNADGLTIDEAITVNRLTLKVGSLSAGTGSFTWGGSNPTLIYNGTGTQSSGIEFPTTNISDFVLCIDNSYGTQPAVTVNLTGARSIGTLQLKNGSFTIVGGGSLSFPAVQYAQSTSYTTTALDWPSSVTQVNINNSVGVILGASHLGIDQLVLTKGSLDLGVNTLTLNDNATISRSAGTILAAPAFGTTVNISYQNTTGITSGNEMPADGLVLNNLTINGSGGVTTLSGPVTVNGTLMLNQGKISTTGTNILKIASAGLISGGSNNSFVDGPMVHTWSSTATKTYPIGVGSVYRPVYVSLTTPSSPVLQMQMVNSNAGGSFLGPLNAISTKRYFQSSLLSGSATSGGTVKLSYGPDDGVSNSANLVVAQSATATGTYTSLGMSANDPFSVTSDGTTYPYNPASGDYLLIGTTGGNALPVQMTKFTAMSKRMGAELQWSTATEKNCYGFEVERRMTSPLSPPYQGGDVRGGWQKIGFVQGNGTSNSPKDYSYTDASVASGTYAYRLKQIDNDGAFEYSSEVEISLSVPKVLALNQNYPNPFNPSTTINFTLAEDSHVSLRVFDMLGREVATLANSEMKAVEVHNVLFDASRLSSGLYFYRLDAGKSSLVKKLMLLK